MYAEKSAAEAHLEQKSTRPIDKVQLDFHLCLRLAKPVSGVDTSEYRDLACEGEVAKSVLIVDDNAAVRHALCALFTSTEFHVCSEAANGQEAIEKAQAMRPDLIVMDLSMPVMNGLQAAAQLRKLMPDTPIILFSEYSDVLPGQDMRAAGLSALVSKGDHTSVLLSKARALVYHTHA